MLFLGIEAICKPKRKQQQMEAAAASAAAAASGKRTVAGMLVSLVSLSTTALLNSLSDERKAATLLTAHLASTGQRPVEAQYSALEAERSRGHGGSGGGSEDAGALTGPVDAAAGDAVTATAGAARRNSAATAVAKTRLGVVRPLQVGVAPEEVQMYVLHPAPLLAAARAHPRRDRHDSVALPPGAPRHPTDAPRRALEGAPGLAGWRQWRHGRGQWRGRRRRREQEGRPVVRRRGG